MMGFDIEGVSRLLERVSVPIHVQAAEADLVKKVTGLSDDCMVSHASGDVVAVGDVEIELIATPGHTPGSQCFLVDGRLVAGDTLFLEGCGRMDLPGSDPAQMYESLTTRLARVPDHGRAVPRTPLLAGVVGHHGHHPGAQPGVPHTGPRPVARRLRGLTAPEAATPELLSINHRTGGELTEVATPRGSWSCGRRRWSRCGSGRA